MRRRFRAFRAGLRERVSCWEPLECGSTNGLWKGESASGAWLLKWYRYPTPGLHPEVEVAEHLSRLEGAAVPAYGGRLDEVLEGCGLSQTVAFVQRWVEGRSAWDWLLEVLRLGEVPVAAARRWGGEIGRLHRLLAAGAPESGFGVKAWEPAFSAAWAARVEGLGELLKQAILEPKPEGLEMALWAEIRGVWLEKEPVWRARARRLVALNFCGERSRIHGDLHLGQLMECAGGGTVVVDFEGEPMRALEERRIKDWPLRDVAGMWRSFAYAAAVSGVGARSAGLLQSAFVEGWREQLPWLEWGWEDAQEELIWEKLIYETLYELRHRPDWVRVPWRDLAVSFCGKTVAPRGGA